MVTFLAFWHLNRWALITQALGEIKTSALICLVNLMLASAASGNRDFLANQSFARVVLGPTSFLPLLKLIAWTTSGFWFRRDSFRQTNGFGTTALIIHKRG